MKRVMVEQLRDELRTMADRCENASLRRVLESCVQPIRDGFASNFAAQEGSDGSPWPPRKPRPDDDGHPLLIETGALMGGTQGGAGKVERVDDRLLELGVDKGVKQGGLPGAAVHNFGYPANNIPQREYLYASSSTLDRCQAIIADGAYTVFFVF